MEYHISSIAIIAAFILDLVMGEPERLPHPVVWMGRVIGLADRQFNAPGMGGNKKTWGIMLAIMLPLGSFAITALVLRVAHSLGGPAAFIATVVLAYTTLSAKGLKDAACRVRDALDKEDIPAAREALSHIVGRSTNELDEAEIIRATVETVAENSSDGVMAPLFFLFIGGVPLAMAYKAVNTLDSMVGYKNDRYKEFGWGPARLDDIANFIPARITALAIVAAAFLLRFDWNSSWQVTLRDGRNHPSPNAGWPEAATAGALGIRLGGINHYPGRVEERPFIGDDKNRLKRRHIRGAVRLMYLATIVMILASLALRGILF